MKHPQIYIFVLGIALLLAVPIVQAIQTLLAMQARVLFPVLRVKTAEGYRTLSTSVSSIDALICPHCASSFTRHVDVTPPQLTQPTEGA